MPSNEDFLKAIYISPDDADVRLVYADWLEEQGSPLQEFIRLRDKCQKQHIEVERRKAANRLLQLLTTETDPVAHGTYDFAEIAQAVKQNQNLCSVCITKVPATLAGIQDTIRQLGPCPFLSEAELILNNNEVEGLNDVLESGSFQHVGSAFPFLRISYPDGRRLLDWVQIGALSAEELEKALDKEKMRVSDYARSMLRNEQFVDPVDERHRKRKESAETLDLICVRVADLGFTSPPTTAEIFDRAQELGLELCPPETGPYQRLAHTNQPPGNWYFVGMEPVAGSDGSPGVFGLERLGGGLWLDDYWADPASRWDLGYGFLFRRRKSGS